MVAIQSGARSAHASVEAAAARPEAAPSIFVCVDATRRARRAVAHGLALSQALGSGLALIRVLEPPFDRETPVDPIDWALRRRESSAQLGALAEGLKAGAGEVDTALLEGPPAERLCAWARDHGSGVLVLAPDPPSDASEAPLGRVARGIVEGAPGPVLLAVGDSGAADAAGVPQAVGYRRVLAPLDGSARAERALPLAMRIADVAGAELVLLHAVPALELTLASPPEPEDAELMRRLFERNRRVAQRYLDRIAARAAARGVAMRTRILSGGDARHLLARAAAEEAADLVVLTTHGCGGHPDVSAGSVADYLMGHSRVPLLVVPPRDAAETRRPDPARMREELRRPDRATP